MAHLTNKEDIVAASLKGPTPKSRPMGLQGSDKMLVEKISDVILK